MEDCFIGQKDVHKRRAQDCEAVLSALHLRELARISSNATDAILGTTLGQNDEGPAGVVAAGPFCYMPFNSREPIREYPSKQFSVDCFRGSNGPFFLVAFLFPALQFAEHGSRAKARS